MVSITNWLRFIILLSMRLKFNFFAQTHELINVWALNEEIA
jgi:hypothetical protein